MGEKLTETLYRLMDNFLVEGDKPRSIENLNKDRHLFVGQLKEAIKARDSFVLGEDEKSGECLCVKYNRAEESL